MKKVTPMKAIRLKCLDCCLGSSNEVKMCQVTQCPLWIYRSGHRPKIDIEEEIDVNINSDTITP